MQRFRYCIASFLTLKNKVKVMKEMLRKSYRYMYIGDSINLINQCINCIYFIFFFRSVETYLLDNAESGFQANRFFESVGVFIGVFSGSFFLGFFMGLVTALVSFLNNSLSKIFILILT